MLSRLEAHHHLVVGKHRRHGINTTRQSLAQHSDVRLDVTPVRAEHASSTGKSSLHLVADKQAVVFLAKGLDLWFSSKHKHMSCSLSEGKIEHR